MTPLHLPQAPWEREGEGDEHISGASANQRASARGAPQFLAGGWPRLCPAGFPYVGQEMYLLVHIFCHIFDAVSQKSVISLWFLRGAVSRKCRIHCLVNVLFQVIFWPHQYIT